MDPVTYRTTASPERVWAVLSNGWLYASWVVGTSRIRSVDAHWPQPGARIEHSVGLWPALLDDETTSLSITDDVLELSAAARPFGRAHIVLTVSAEPDGATITMDEHAETAPARWIPADAQRAIMSPRLRECLRRLSMLAEHDAG